MGRIFTWPDPVTGGVHEGPVAPELHGSFFLVHGQSIAESTTANVASFATRLSLFIIPSIRSHSAHNLWRCAHGSCAKLRTRQFLEGPVALLEVTSARAIRVTASVT